MVFLNIQFLPENPQNPLEYGEKHHYYSAPSFLIGKVISSVHMLHLLRPASGSRKRRKRIARGNAGDGGTTAGRGTKGQHSRTGKGMKFGFEGGQVPLIRRQPKLGGFTSPRKVMYSIVNLSVLEEKLPAGSYSIQDLVNKRLVHGNKPIKILARGEVKKKFELEANAASKAAKEAVKAAGGSITLKK